MDEEKYYVAEALLAEWIAVTSTIQNERIVKHMTYNEAIVCNHLWRQLRCCPNYLTQTELCKLTGIKKSLMNRIVRSLEEKELIEYVKNDNDRRVMPIRFNVAKEDVFLQEHNNSIEVVKKIVDVMEMDKAKVALQSLKDINAGAKSVFGIK